ncbi:unnamed protein product [Zymoseptoria tritici ST99CH_3D7]|uniref:Uncharacterized protein n=1 Tax=Zymoseptoria tritici (strain ST99CH_3D7) TaxID=1276538 RepID=A0A1X7RX13_ZYMT9|nr:unnamed protein product [Zymoseptoria tritici ST99CH_3D7]
MGLLEAALSLVTATNIILLIITAYVAQTYLASRSLAHIPGPFLSNYTTIPLLWKTYRGTLYHDIGELIAKHGPLVRIAPGRVITGSAKTWAKITAARSPYLRSDWNDAMRFAPGQDNVLSMRDEKAHSDLRMKMAAGYSGKENPDLEKTIDGVVMQFVKLIEEKYLSDAEHFKPMDLTEKFHFFTLDTITALAFGESFGDLKDDNDKYDYLKELEKSITSIIMLADVPWLWNFLERTNLMSLLLPGEELGLGKATKIAKDLVDARFEGSSDGKPTIDRMDMMGSFLRHSLTRQQVESETVLQLIAGSDTTATAISTVFLNVLTSPPIYQKLMREIDETCIPGLAIGDAKARTMIYLQACIKESLRIAPPVSGVFPKLVPPGGETIDGYFVPEGTKIGWSSKAVTQNPELYGPDASCFRPERWILQTHGGDCESVDKLLQMERDNAMIFGAGRFKCLGQAVAVLELNKIVVELLRRFEMRTCDSKKPLAYEFNIGIWIQHGVWMRVTKRERYSG